MNVIQFEWFKCKPRNTEQMSGWLRKLSIIYFPPSFRMVLTKSFIVIFNERNSLHFGKVWGCWWNLLLEQSFTSKNQPQSNFGVYGSLFRYFKLISFHWFSNTNYNSDKSEENCVNWKSSCKSFCWFFRIAEWNEWNEWTVIVVAIQWLDKRCLQKLQSFSLTKKFEKKCWKMFIFYSFGKNSSIISIPSGEQNSNPFRCLLQINWKKTII